jgi:DNA polymerase III gamma/tau subunit
VSDTHSLALSLRPKIFSQFIGNQDIVKAVQAILLSGNTPVGWLLAGPTGTGKTTLALLISEAVRGVPLVDNDPDIVEHNASDLNGVDDVRELVRSASTNPLRGRFRVVILNECHRLTEPAQNVLLQPGENAQSSTIWIFTTTEPQKLLKTLRDRCMGSFTLKPFGAKEREELLSRATARFGIAAQPIIDAVNHAGLTSGREILNACDRWIAGMKPADAVSAPGNESNPLYADIAKVVLSGNWPKAQETLSQIKTADAKGLRSVLAAFMRSKMLRGDDKITGVIEAAAMELPKLESFEDGVLYTGLVAFMRRLARGVKQA